MQELYDQAFYENRDTMTRHSAELIAGLVHEIVQPNSVCDVGCGVGTWLNAFRSIGISDIMGLDGEWVDKSKLVIPVDTFLQADFTAPPILNRTFDLAISLEVAEHIPPEKANVFVDYLTSLAPVLIFSAAIPGQGGVGHVNEQWPSYWAHLFSMRRYKIIDFVRPNVWDSQELPLWYQQNIFIFVRHDKEELISKFQRGSPFHKPSSCIDDEMPPMIDVVHRKMFLLVQDSNRILLRKNESLEARLSALRNKVNELNAEQLSIKRNGRLLIRNIVKKLGFSLA